MEVGPLKVIVKKSETVGTVCAPPSKSCTHRAIICGLLSSDTTRIRNPLYCDDTEATLDVAQMLGARIDRGSDIRITGPIQLRTPDEEMDCRGSGTTLRLFTALSSLTQGRCILTGNESLVRRPIEGLLMALRQLGIKAKSIHRNDRPPVEVQGGTLTGGPVSIEGNVSSQYISGLLFACSKASGNSTLTITTELESKDYVGMTIEVMAQFGVSAEVQSDWRCIEVQGKQEYHSTEFHVEGDYSSASFLMATGALSGDVVVSGLRRGSIQGDAEIASILKKMGASVRIVQEGVRVEKSNLRACSIDASHIPDLVPVLTLIATQASGTTHIYNAGRLRHKESDRLISSTVELAKMGADITVRGDTLDIKGPTRLIGDTLCAHEDHRIAMTCILAGVVAEGETTIRGAESIKKSYPNFIRDVRRLGAEIQLLGKEQPTGGIA